VKCSKEGESNKVFTFDMVFEPMVKQQTVFQKAALPIVESVLEGYNGTGKTFTMEGDKSSPEEKGIIPRTFDHIFKSIEGSYQLM
jgi:hypothetical protein